MAKDKDDIFNENNEVKIPFANWDKVGKSYKGVYVDRDVVPNSLNPATSQAIYTLAEATMRADEKSEAEEIEGGILKIGGRGNRNPAVIPQMEMCKLGQVVAVKFTEEREPKKAGHSGAKIIRVFTKKEMKPEVLAEYGGEDMVDAEKVVEEM